jgi:RNA polymerase sigma-70 factor
MAKPAKPGPASLARTHARLLDRLWEAADKSAAAFGGCPRAVFVAALERSVGHRFPDGGAADAVGGFLESLNMADLALAAACQQGGDAAWEHFVREYRPGLLSAARAICRSNEAAARELADSLYAELFGVRGEAAERRSLFDYYHGRSKLSTWLRSILAQRRIDQIRASRRTESLDEQNEEHGEDAVLTRAQRAGIPPAEEPDRPRLAALLQAALTAGLGALPARDRLRLACYYLRDMTLAQIGRLLGEHEATASRHLERTRRDLRKHVEQALREKCRLSDAQIQLCYECAGEKWQFDLTQALGAAEAEK